MKSSRVLLLCFVLFLPTLAFAGWRPSGFQKVTDDVDTTLHQVRIGAELMHYNNGVDWVAIDNTWVTEGNGPSKVWKCDTDVLKVEVNQSGLTTLTVDWDDTTYVIEHQFGSLIFENSQTGTQVAIAGLGGANFGQPDVSGNTLSWTTHSGVTYQVIRRNATIIHKIVFEPTFSANIVSLGGGLPNFENWNLSTNVDYSFENLDNPEEGNTYETEFKNFGQYQLAMRRQHLQWSEQPDTVMGVPIVQNWSAGNMKERVPLPNIQAILNANPNAVISHNDETTIGAASIESTFGYETAPDYYEYDHWAMRVNDAEGTDYHIFIRVKGVAAALGVGATISSAVCSLSCKSDNNNECKIGWYRIFKPWVHEDATSWNDWDQPDNEWGTAGCNNVNDAGVDNSGDGSGDDRTETQMGDSLLIVQSDPDCTFFGLVITTAVAQGWYDETMEEEGIMIKEVSTAKGFIEFWGEESAVVSVRPRFSFTFGGATTATGQIINIEEE